LQSLHKGFSNIKGVKMGIPAGDQVTWKTKNIKKWIFVGRFMDSVLWMGMEKGICGESWKLFGQK
jgi:hypothetical protein